MQFPVFISEIYDIGNEREEWFVNQPKPLLDLYIQYYNDVIVNISVSCSIKFYVSNNLL